MEEYDWFEHKTRDICELLNDYHTEQLSLGTVSQQRELLSAFQKKWNKYDDVTKIRNKDIDAYIKGNL
jgi:hypothetical protein